MRGKRGVKAVVLLLALLTAIPRAFAVQFKAPDVLAFLTGPRGFLPKLNVFLTNDYVQYFGTLFVVGFLVTMIVKSVLTKIKIIEEEKFQNVIAIILGFGTANGVFIFFRNYPVEASFLTIWGSGFTIVLWAGLLGIPAWINFTENTGVNSMFTSITNALERWIRWRPGPPPGGPPGSPPPGGGPSP